MPASAQNRPILAERFKTQTCKTFVETGACKYEERCMFAHGGVDLRTKAMNVKDGLTKPDAIRRFQKKLKLDAAERSIAAATTCFFSTSPVGNTRRHDPYALSGAATPIFISGESTPDSAARSHNCCSCCE